MKLPKLSSGAGLRGVIFFSSAEPKSMALFYAVPRLSNGLQ